jgi:TorA maturation chaperone TorD
VAVAGEGRGEGIDAALARGTLYTALALGFRPPTDETLARLANPDAADALAEAAAVLAPELSACAAVLAHPDLDLDRLAAAHRRLFGHTARGEVPAYETEYGNEALFQQPQELSDLAGFAAAFGLALRADVHERIDHVSCECEFLAFLAFKEAYAIHAGDDAMRAAAAQASALFLRDHLGRLVPAFARGVARADADGFYCALAALLLALASREGRRLGVPLGSEGLGLRPDPSAVAAPMGCAGCESAEPTG